MVALSALLITAATSFSNTANSPTLSRRDGKACPPQITCPADTGCVATSAQGDQYLVTCNADFYGGDLQRTSTPTLEKCLVACSYTAPCIGVSYKGSICYMKKEITSNVDGVGVRQQYPFQDTCPLSDVNAYCSSHGGNTGTAGCFEATDREPQYVVRCARDFYGGDIAPKDLPDLSTCIQSCQALGKTNCAGVSWEQREGWGLCYLKTLLKAAVYNEKTIGVIIV